MKEDARNRHSLAGAIGISWDELLSVLEIFGVCRKCGNNINVRNDVVLWVQTDGLNTYFNSGSNINLSRSRCTSSSNSQIFLRLLGAVSSDSECVSIPSLQRLEDASPVESFGLEDRTVLLNLKNSLKKIIHSLNGGESSADVADLDECDDSIARRDTTTVSNSNTVDNTSNSLSSLDHLDSSSIAHSSSVNTATLEVVQKEVLMYADALVGEKNVPLIPVLLKNLVKNLIHFGNRGIVNLTLLSSIEAINYLIAITQSNATAVAWRGLCWPTCSEVYGRGRSDLFKDRH